ncbi:hypothetical protein [Streptomyces sp. NPDC048142]|uniref:hypothetical protein n=1 Tax=Streptomyces sp. NPDC048142 TaxID=3365501 RepID=UPI003724B6C7
MTNQTPYAAHAAGLFGPVASSAAEQADGPGSADGPGTVDLPQAERVREAQCLLGTAFRKGGAEMKKVARDGIAGTDAELLAAADQKYWQTTPLATAFDADRDAAFARAEGFTNYEDSLRDALRVRQIPPGYTDTGFQWPPRDPDLFTQAGIAPWVGVQMWLDEPDFYKDPHPPASPGSVNAVTSIATERYSEDDLGDLADWQAWQGMTFMHPMYADDARLFLKSGGFPTSAPEPDSPEFRIDVEDLKARFASCAFTNPPDPHAVLVPEVAVASTEWRDEVAGQSGPRGVILGAEAEASRLLQIAAELLGQALGQSLIADRLTDWEAYFLKQSPDTVGLDYPTPAEFKKVRDEIAQAREWAGFMTFVAGNAAGGAQAQADLVTAAQQEAYEIADERGLPRGRGLLHAQQAAQVTLASAAATEAIKKAIDTASEATRASAADSKTLHALAQTQAHASTAEFRRKAAETAEAQAKAAAEGAAAQAAQAAVNASDAKKAEGRAKAAETAAKTAAADAKAKRATAEAERDKAKAAKELAATERAKATSFNGQAQSQREVASESLKAAQSAGSTASTKKDEALEAEARAATARDAALTAERNRDVLNVRAAALEAQAAADEGTAAAEASRAAATRARTAANDATNAATAARTAADGATTAAGKARADVATTEAAVAKAHAAAADAINAAGQAKRNAAVAKAQADEAERQALSARSDAETARSEAALAGADAVRTAGYAYATAQAAAAARDSAAQVVKPANDAIELGSPYAESDASAGLAVLTGQASKTVAEQQAAVADAKADQAAKAAVEAR